MEQSVSARFACYLQCAPLAESSRAIKRRAAAYFKRFCGDPPVDQVTHRHGEDFRDGIFTSLVRRGRDIEKAKNTANIYLKNLKPFFSWLLDGREIPVHPIRSVREFSLNSRRPRPFAPDEIGRMLTVADPCWRAMICLALMSMRKGEILNLAVSDIQFEQNLILLTPKRRTAATWPWSIKNYQQAYIPLPPVIQTATGLVELHRLLIERITWLPARQPYIFVSPDRYQWMLARQRAGELSCDNRANPWGNFTRDFHGLLRRAQVERRRFHDLRGTFATTMGDRLPLCKIQKLMRHASPQTTVQYIHVDEQRLAAESAAILKKCYA